MTGHDKKSRASGAGGRAVSARRAGANSPRNDTEGPSAVDMYVGARVRARRTALGMSQEKLGNSVGLTFQQIQKYERGSNRIGASRLFEFSTILDVPISYFYEAMPADTVADVRSQFADDAALSDLGPETLRLIKLYYRIGRADVRRRLYELVKAVSLEWR